MARTPLCPISSAATIRSLLVTPSSFASSITLILAAATSPSPPVSHCHWRSPRLVYRTLELRVQTTAAAQRLGESTALQRTLQTRHLDAHVRPAPDRAACGVADDDAVGAPHQPYQLTLGAALA